jgi:hypothetical protein
MEQQMNITQIVATEPSGFCDVATGECIVVDPTPDAGPDADSPHGTSERPEEADGEHPALKDARKMTQLQLEVHP